MADPVIFQASRAKATALLLLAVAFVAIGLWMATERPLEGYLTAGFFALGIPASLYMMRPGASYLKLDAEGFEVVDFRRRHRCGWRDVDAFEVRRIFGLRMIGIVFSAGYRGRRALRTLSSAVAGLEGAIGNHYAAPLDEILAALNDRKARFGSG